MLVAAEVGWGWLAAFGEGHHAALVAASLLLGLVGCVLRAGAFVHFAVAFAGNEQARDRRVRRAAGMLMRAYAVLFLGAACNLFLSSALSHRLQEAAYIVLPVLSYVPLVVAAALVAKAFAPRDPGGPGQDATSRDRLLGRAGAYVALGAALILACWFLRGWPRLGLGD